MPSPTPQDDPINRWARELKTLTRADRIKAFRARFDKPTAQRIIRSAELDELDRACISLAVTFAGASRFGYGEAEIIDLEPEGEGSLPSGDERCSTDGRARFSRPPQS